MTEPTSSPLRQQPVRPPAGSDAAAGQVERGQVSGVAGPGPDSAAPGPGLFDTQPIPVITAVDPTAVAPVLVIRAGLALLAAVGAVVAAVFLYRHGLSDHVYPAFVAGADHTDVVRYRGPWIGGAFVAVLIAGLLVLQAVQDLRRRATTAR